jgi:hypothetical protein
LKFLCPLELSSCLTLIKNLFQVRKTIPAMLLSVSQEDGSRHRLLWNTAWYYSRLDC